MIKPDLLVTWHESCDYPIARRFLKRHRDFFGKIIIYFSKHFRNPVYTPFLKESMEDLENILYLDPIEYKYGEEDWRDVSTNYMLKHTDSEWISSVEQDFFCRDWNKLLSKTSEAMKENDLIGWWQENNKYIHPSYFFIKREMLEKTNKDFSARSPHDHFGWIFEDVKRFGGKIKSIQEMGFADFKDSFHLGGVNDNYLNFDVKFKSNSIHREKLFYIYNYWSIKADISQSPEFMALCEKVDFALKSKLPETDPENNEWVDFFK